MAQAQGTTGFASATGDLTDQRIRNLELQLNQALQVAQQAQADAQAAQTIQVQVAAAQTTTPGGTAAQAGGNQAQVQAPRPFALNPASSVNGLLNFNDKIHVGLHSKAVASLYGDSDKDKYDLTPETTQTFLNLIYDRGVNCNLSVLQVPATVADVAAALPATKNICKHHGELSQEVIEAFTTHYLGTNTRLAQDDNMLALLIQNSLTKRAYEAITTDRSDFETDGLVCGLRLLKTVLIESALDSRADPDVIRMEIATAPSKFAEFNYDVGKINIWMKGLVTKLQQCGESSTDIKPHLFQAYMTSNDPDFVTYIKALRDRVRENPTEAFTYKTLMQRAKEKYDSTQRDLLRSQVTQTIDSPLVALQTELKEHKKTINKLQKQYRSGSSSPRHKSKQAGSPRKFNGKSGGNNGKKPPPFPQELRTKAAPSDPSKPLVIDGIKYWYCTNHAKWCKHSTSDCQKGQSGSNDSNGNGGGKKETGKRHGRLVSALCAIRG